MPHCDPTPLVDRFSGVERAVEVGIGRRHDVAAALADRGVRVIATDVEPRGVPDGVRFVLDDVTDPDLAVYADADAIYALNLPPDLHHPTLDVAREVDAELLFTTLGGEQPAIPVERETLPTDTLYRARPAPTR